MIDTTLLILLGLAALGFISHNTTVAVSILVLIILRVTPLSTFFPWVEKQGLSIGIIILTISVMAPIASGTLPASTLIQFSPTGNRWSPSASAYFVPVARWARRDADGHSAASGGRAIDWHRAGRRAVSRRAGGAADCGGPGVAAYWEVVVSAAR